MKILCVFGQYQYGDPSRGQGTEYANFISAFKNLGHEVVHFESWDRSKYRDFSDLNYRLIETVERERPDIMLTVQKSYEIWIETLEIIKKRGDVATICWTTDDSWKYKECSRFIGKYYHAITTTYENKIAEYHKDHIYNVLLTQWAANTDYLKEPLPAAKCRYPITFIGAAHGNRKKRIRQLRELGLEIRCFGYGWPDGSVDTAEMNEIIRNSVISLNFANSKGDNQVKARTFEVPGAGGFLLTEHAAGLEHYYLPDKEIVTFSSTYELIEKVKYYLHHPQERDIIAKAGHTRTCMEHTYDLRMQELINFAIKAKNQTVNISPNNGTDHEKLFEEACRKYKQGGPKKVISKILCFFAVLIWGKQRGPRAARRLIYEISWRIVGEKTYSAAGWPGRYFYKHS